MIRIVSTDGERQIVASLDGYGPEWSQEGPTLPAGEPSMLILVEGAWRPDLSALRAQAWAWVKAERDRAECAGCDTALGRVDTDPDSQRKIVGATLAAQLSLSASTTFSIDWTMADDSAVTHDAAAMIAMGLTVGEHVAACHAIGRAKRAAIGAAVDPAAIAAAAEGWA